MILTWIIFLVAIALSAVAAFYSIVGLAAIFSAAVMPIVIMGTILEIAKLTVTVWLHEHWHQCRWIMKAYLVPAVVVLMIITSMGIFGFLSKAHIDQIIPVGDRTAQLVLFDERIANERAVVENSRSLIRQMDAAVNGVIATGDQEVKARDGTTRIRSAAERSLQIRRSQAKDRDALTNTINEAQKRIVTLQEERSPVAKEVRGLEAEVGPIKYVAALIYGDNPDTDLMERSVRWVIIILVAVFDPLAIMMLLAGTESLKWSRESQRKDTPDDSYISPEPDVVRDTDPDPPRDLEPDRGHVEPHVPPVMAAGPAYLDQGDSGFQNLEPTVLSRTSEITKTVEHQTEDNVLLSDNSVNESNVSNERPIDIGNGYIQFQGKVYSHGSFIESFPELNNNNRLTASFGLKFPNLSNKGDIFVRTDYMPTRVFKFNGKDWMEVDKNLNSSVTYNDNYIDHLIEKISKGEYDLELLSDREQEQIEKKLKNDKQAT